MNILSIQSSVVYGHVGNSAAVFPLQRLGIEVWPINTVHFSNHTGYGSWGGAVLPTPVVEDIVRGLSERGVLSLCDGLLSGYMGDVSLGRVILDLVQRVRAEDPSAAYCLDPVMGDTDRGFYVRPGISELMRDDALPLATVITPNQFELEFLAGRPVVDLESTMTAVNLLRERGPRVVLVTSLSRADSDSNMIEILAADEQSACLIATPRLPLSVNGAGDATAAIFFAHWLMGSPIAVALEKTVNSVFAVLALTAERNAREIQLIAAQDQIANPPEGFRAVKIR
ncbi:MAG: pyridoxal kinase PdxY [Verrucomicrobia bacterium]|nr:pyridoxal kinase PdxY [Verrucomicrobiota bacterium]MBV8276508.1 pyridoxal kinase PdxY [Verrucomicrobiota bacterium]